jgi:hypothetical protein
MPCRRLVNPPSLPQVGDWTFNLFKLGDGPDDAGAESPVVVGPYAKCYLTCAR